MLLTENKWFSYAHLPKSSQLIAIKGHSSLAFGPFPIRRMVWLWLPPEKRRLNGRCNTIQ
jgi:hypothetical protein